MNNTRIRKIIIVGGGFAGIKCALDLAKQELNSVKIVLISDKPHFEYHAALYRIVTGHSPLEVCIPLSRIFKNTNVEVIQDKITKIDLHNKSIYGEDNSHYTYDNLVLALGSETDYFNIPGLQEFSFGIKSINEALRLKRHLHDVFSSCTTTEDKKCSAHIVIVGAGATGVELAGELAPYAKKMAKHHGIDPTMVKIDLVEAAPRILPLLPEEISAKAAKRLSKLGVNILTSKKILKSNVDEIVLDNMEMRSKTLIWTAGVTAHHLYKETAGLEIEGRGKVKVTNLNPDKFNDVFILGDGASTKYSGMAQTAIYDGEYAAKRLTSKDFNYSPQSPIFAIPVGSNFSYVYGRGLNISGILGWWIRRFVDFKVYLTFLSLNDAITAFDDDKSLCESCSICSVQ